MDDLASAKQIGAQKSRLTRLAWWLVLGVGIGLNLLALPLQLARWEKLCSDMSCALGQLTSQQAQELPLLGLTLQSWAAYLTFNWILPAIVFVLVGAMVFWRKRDDRIAFFASVMLIAVGLSSSIDAQSTFPILQQITRVYQGFGYICLIFFIFVFPDGQFVPGWMLGFAVLVALRQLLATLLPADPVLNGLPFYMVEIPVGVLFQVYRYRRVSNETQRKQTKWVVFGIALSASGLVGVGVFFTVVYPFSTAALIPGLLGITCITFLFLLVPLSFGIAILRSGLWDIDLIIRRTLIYSVVTTLLAVVYLGSVFILQEMFRLIVGRQSEVAVITSTLVIAALFNPLRRRVQEWIDRRFYQRKYDAARVLAHFALAARDEVDLDKLTEELMTVVQDTMQPASASLWLRPANQAPDSTRGH